MLVKIMDNDGILNTYLGLLFWFLNSPPAEMLGDSICQHWMGFPYQNETCLESVLSIMCAIYNDTQIKFDH